MSAHTPGPWELAPCGDILGNRSTATDNGLVCTMCIDRRDDEGAANADLIAAAPDTAAERDRLRAVNADLLAALSCIVLNARLQPDAHMAGTTDCYAIPTDDIEAARAVIAKATGRK